MHRPDLRRRPLAADHADHVTATMFLLGGQVQAHPDLVRREQALGLEIGNHTMTHVMLNKSSDATVDSELSRTQDAIQAVTGQRPTIMRPPYAARNRRTDADAGKQGLSVIVWDSSPQDWVNHDTATIVRKTEAGARPNTIILMHDTHPWTVQAVPQIITDLRAQGYTFVTVSELLGPTQPGVLYPKS